MQAKEVEAQLRSRLQDVERERDEAIAGQVVLARALGETWFRFDTFCLELAADSGSAAAEWERLVEYEIEVGVILRDLSAEAKALLEKAALAQPGIGDAKPG
jgi:hypothetical protein